MKLTFKTKMINLLVFVSILLCTSNIPSRAYEPEAVKAYNQAIDFSKTANYQDAIMYFKKAILLDPNFTDAYFNLGSIYEYQNENDLALEAFITVFKNNPNDYESIYKIANIYNKKGEYKKALNYLSIIPASSDKYLSAYDLQKKIQAKILTGKTVTKPPSKPKSTKKPASTIRKTVLNNFNGPTGIAKDKNNNLYVANFTSNSIVKIYPDGKRKIIASGKPISGPVGIAVDSNNNLYVANYKSNEILKITPTGSISVILKGVKRPYYLLLDDNILYISEQGNNTVIKLKF